MGYKDYLVLEFHLVDENGETLNCSIPVSELDSTRCKIEIIDTSTENTNIKLIESIITSLGTYGMTGMTGMSIITIDELKDKTLSINYNGNEIYGKFLNVELSIKRKFLKGTAESVVGRSPKSTQKKPLSPDAGTIEPPVKGGLPPINKGDEEED